MLIGARILAERVGEADWPPDVIVHNLRRGLPFDAASFDGIYASHVIEHLYRTDARRLLGECRRVLRPGGVLRVVVPDLAAIVKEYVGGERIGSSNGDGQRHEDSCERLNHRLMLRQDDPPTGPVHMRLYFFFNDFHSHKWMYDAPNLVTMFRDAGFSDARPRAYLESAIPGIGEVERGSRVLEGEGFIVEGRRADAD